MHIKVGDFHPELQHQVPRLRRMAKLMRVPGVIRIIDWLRRREAGSDVTGLECSTVKITSSLDDYCIRTRIYRPCNVSGPLPCLVYFHGGGYIMGVPEGSAELIKRFIQTRPCVVIAPDYRKAHQKPFPGGFQDCYDALIWARNNTGALGCSGKIIIGGHSAGGGLTAAAALKARDTGDVEIAFQMPFYPMIDDMQPTDPHRGIDPPVWDTARIISSRTSSANCGNSASLSARKLSIDINLSFNTWSVKILSGSFCNLLSIYSIRSS